jgi:hypothetical protein
MIVENVDLSLALFLTSCFSERRSVTIDHYRLYAEDHFFGSKLSIAHDGCNQAP